MRTTEKERDGKRMMIFASRCVSHCSGFVINSGAWSDMLDSTHMRAIYEEAPILEKEA
jgi:hypothetical protein